MNKRHREKLARLLTQFGSKDPERFIPPDEQEQQERQRQERERRARERRDMPFGHGFFR